jgi:hypothetical protein
VDALSPRRRGAPGRRGARRPARRAARRPPRLSVRGALRSGGALGQWQALRVRCFDDEVRRFLARHPDGQVVALGEGLQTQFWRVDDDRVRWLTVEVPEVAELRDRLLPASPRRRTIAGSALDERWMDEVDGARGARHRAGAAHVLRARGRPQLPRRLRAPAPRRRARLRRRAGVDEARSERGGLQSGDGIAELPGIAELRRRARACRLLALCERVRDTLRGGRAAPIHQDRALDAAVHTRASATTA